MSKPAEHIVATILGCGSSGGVPRIGNHWGACDPSQPRNRRRRCSLLLEGTTPGHSANTTVLIDTGCDLREQMLDAGVTDIHAVLYTHAHADHTHGIDDLRVLAINGRRRVDVYFSAETGKRLHEAFDYCFVAPAHSPYPAILNAHVVAPGEDITVDGPGGTIEIRPFELEHGDVTSLGFRIGGVAYCCDVSNIPDRSLAALSELDVWIVDALKATPHPSHFSLVDALGWIERLEPRQAVLTNMHTDLDYARTEAGTPANVTPAYDGMRIDVLNGRLLAR